MTGADNRALTFAAALLLLTSTLRYGVEVVRGPGLPPDSATVLPALLDESREAGVRDRLRSRPLEPDERIDPNRAPEVQLDRLPGVGPGTARAIVAFRDELGPFRTRDDLLAVRGIGPSTLERMRPHLALPDGGVRGRGGGSGGSTRPAGTRGGSPPGPRAERGRRATESGSSTRGRGRGSGPARAPVDLNRADAAELEALPGVGPALAGRILEVRTRLGRFSRVEQLTQVRGIGATTVERLRPLVRVR